MSSSAQNSHLTGTRTGSTSCKLMKDLSCLRYLL